MTATAERQVKPSRSVVLVGLENVGKSALFRNLTHARSGDESNFRGSTVDCRRQWLDELQGDLVDTPGIRVHSDSATTRLALQQLTEADNLVLVVRATDAWRELQILLDALSPLQQDLCILSTFADKLPDGPDPLGHFCRTVLGVPYLALDARRLDELQHLSLLLAIGQSSCLPINAAQLLQAARPTELPSVQPVRTAFEHRCIGPILALSCLGLLFALPVYLAFQLSGWLQPWFDAWLIQPASARLEGTPELLQHLLVGSYGVFSLGCYSFVWAFPVVALVGLSVALCEESGLKDRITSALDPWLRRIGLSGQDLIPILTGFGCNVVAVFQSRACSACSRRACLGAIAFGSACSYQIGATLSVFNASGHLMLFLPYILLLTVVSALHTRVWNGRLAAMASTPLSERAFLQWPSYQAVLWRLRGSIRQFLWQAMPIFLTICLVASLFDWLDVLDWLGALIAPAMRLLHLPEEMAPGLIFSLLRKDGLLVLNFDAGQPLAQLSASQVFLLAWLASTFSACLVTLWAIGREIGLRFAATLAARQALSSLLVAVAMALLLQMSSGAPL